MKLLPSDEIVVLSPLSVHEAAVRLRSVLPEEFGDLGRVDDAKVGDTVEMMAARDWSDSRRAFRLRLTLHPAESGCRALITTQGRPSSVLAETVLGGCAAGIVLYKTGWSIWLLMVVGGCVGWLPAQCAAAYKAEKERLLPVVMRALSV